MTIARFRRGATKRSAISRGSAVPPLPREVNRNDEINSPRSPTQYCLIASYLFESLFSVSTSLNVRQYCPVNDTY